MVLGLAAASAGRYVAAFFFFCFYCITEWHQAHSLTCLDALDLAYLHFALSTDNRTPSQKWARIDNDRSTDSVLISGEAGKNKQAKSRKQQPKTLQRVLPTEPYNTLTRGSGYGVL